MSKSPAPANGESAGGAIAAKSTVPVVADIHFDYRLALMALEQIGTLRRQRVSAATRWTSNIGLYVIGGLVATVVLPIGIYAFARDRSLHQ